MRQISSLLIISIISILITIAFAVTSETEHLLHNAIPKSRSTRPKLKMGLPMPFETTQLYNELITEQEEMLPDTTLFIEKNNVIGDGNNNSNNNNTNNNFINNNNPTIHNDDGRDFLALQETSLTDGEDTLYLNAILTLDQKSIHFNGDILRFYIKSPWIPNIDEITVRGYCGHTLCISTGKEFYKPWDDIPLSYNNISKKDKKPERIFFLVQVRFADAVLVNPLSLEVSLEYQFVDRTVLRKSTEVWRGWNELFTSVHWYTPCVDKKCSRTTRFHLVLEDFILPQAADDDDDDDYSDNEYKKVLQREVSYFLPTQNNGNNNNTGVQTHIKKGEDLKNALLIESSFNSIFTGVSVGFQTECTLNHYPIAVSAFSTGMQSVVLLLDNPDITLSHLQTFSIECDQMGLAFLQFGKDYTLSISAGFFNTTTSVFTTSATYIGLYMHKSHRPEVEWHFRQSIYDSLGNTEISGYMDYTSHVPKRFDKFLLCGLEEASILRFTLIQKINNADGKQIQRAYHLDGTNKKSSTAYNMPDPFDTRLSWQEMWDADGTADEDNKKKMQMMMNNNMLLQQSGTERVCVSTQPFYSLEHLTSGKYMFTIHAQLSINANARPWADSTGERYNDLFFLVLGSVSTNSVGFVDWRYRGPLNAVNNIPALSPQQSLDDKSINNVKYAMLSYTSIEQQQEQHNNNNNDNNTQQHKQQLTASTDGPFFLTPLTYKKYNKTDPVHYNTVYLAHFYKEYPFNVHLPRVVINLNLTRSAGAFKSLDVAQIALSTTGGLTLLPVDFGATNYPNIFDHPELAPRIHTPLKCNTLLRTFDTSQELFDYIKQYPDNTTNEQQDQEYWRSVTYNHNVETLTMNITEYQHPSKLPFNATGYMRIIIDCGSAMRIVAPSRSVLNSTSVFGLSLYRTPTPPQRGMVYYTYTSTLAGIENILSSPEYNQFWHQSFWKVGWTAVLILIIAILSGILALLVVFAIFNRCRKQRVLQQYREREAAAAKLRQDLSQSRDDMLHLPISAVGGGSAFNTNNNNNNKNKNTPHEPLLQSVNIDASRSDSPYAATGVVNQLPPVHHPPQREKPLNPAAKKVKGNYGDFF